MARFDANDWGYRAAISAGSRDQCPYTDQPYRQQWLDGYDEALRVRPQDVTAARIACGWTPERAAVAPPAS